MNIILQGVVGSQAYGLAHENSDVDRLGIYAAEPEWFFTLREPKGSIVTTHPDSTLHEARKFCQLALQCNPSVLELLWLDSHEIKTAEASFLISIRNAFLSRKRVRDAYLGYANQQAQRIQRNHIADADETVIAKRTRVAKHARHVYRLLEQGISLWTHGTFSVRVRHPDKVMAFGEAVAMGDTDLLAQRFRVVEQLFDTIDTALPEHPHRHVIEMWLLNLRMNQLEGRTVEVPA